ncbi:MAG: exo-alpha-sialidase [Verrucomicrobiaceae bacterium]|nr:exo-alpha-sialidase [Verrucomicrobiaceae bacterium]
MKLIISLLFAHCALLSARDIRVGIDKDAPTIALAIKLAQPGDTIHLEPKVYNDYAGFYGKKGEPGRPITLDGHGATLEGSDPLKVEDWKEVSPGLFANDNLIARNDDAIIGRWFFLWNGRMNHMGRTSKGRQEPLKRPEELQPNEWTFVKDPSREKPPSKQIYGTFYLKLPAGKKLADANIRAPMRSAGVQMSGDNAHLVIKNLTATHPYNDGFNIHGDCRACRFENIRAMECGDDGVSAHESAEYSVDGLVSIGNSTGITDTVAAHTSYNRVFIADCLGHDLFFLDNGRYKVTNAIVLSSSQNPFVVTGREGQRAELIIDNVLLRRLGEHSSPAQVTRTAALTASRFAIENLPTDWKGDVKIDDKPADVKAILAAFGDSMRADALQKHASFLLPRAVTREGTAPAPVITAPEHCAWPNLKLLPDGKLAAFIFNNASHGHHPGDVECWLSEDGGARWSLASAATQHEPETIRMNHAAGLAKNGDLLVLTAGWSNLWPPGVPRTRGSFRYDVLAPWLSRSHDGGRTWCVSKDAVPPKLPSRQPGTPFGDVAIAQDGDLCVGIYGTLDPLDKYEDRRFRSWLYRSKDDGATWGDPVVIGPEHNETNIVHLGGGRWLACARGGTGVTGRDFMDLFASTDDGRTWTKKRQLTGFQRVNGHLLKLKDGRVLFTYGDRAADPGRKGIEAMISKDDGATWSAPIRVIDWNGLDGGYPSSVQRADGQIVTAYYSSALDGEPHDSMKGYHLAVVAWDADRSFALPTVDY